MAEKLKIYACSGIGTMPKKREAVKSYAYWLDGTNTLYNTQAVNTLLALINCNMIEANRLQLSEDQLLERLNLIDLYCVCLRAAKAYTNDTKALRQAGTVISGMVAAGLFASEETNASARDEDLNTLLAYFDSRMERNMSASKKTDKAFDKWFEENVIARNKNVLTQKQKETASVALKQAAQKIQQKISGIGEVDWSLYGSTDWLQNADLAEMLTAGADYFIYTYFTDAQLAKLPAVFRSKKSKQMRTYNYCKALFVDVYGDEAMMQRIIRAGIVDTLEAEPEVFCDAVVNGEKEIKGVGVSEFLAWLGVKGLIALITVVGSIILSIVAAICDTVKQTNISKYGSLNQEILKKSLMDESDYDWGDFPPKKATDWLPILAIGAAAWLFLRN